MGCCMRGLIVTDGPDLIKVQNAGEPLVATWWTCPLCGFSQRGAPPAVCQGDNPDCLLGGDRD